MIHIKKPSRFSINFHDWTENQAKEYNNCYKILLDNVKPEREKQNREVRKKYWWRFAERATKLYNTAEKNTFIFGRSLTSKYHYITILDKTNVIDQTIIAFCTDSYYKYSIIHCGLHFEWINRESADMMGTGNRYNISNGLETFPFPQRLSLYQMQKLEDIGKVYHEHRKQLMLSIQLGLTKTYNAFHAKEVQVGIGTQALQQLDKKAIEKQYGKEVWNLWNHLQKTPNTCSIEEAIAGIVKLRELHVEMDNAVLEAYGWAGSSPSGEAGVRLRHDFYEVDYLPGNDRIRFTIHPEARKEILKRLLELNHKMFEQETLQGLHKEKNVVAFYEQKGVPVPEGVNFSDKKVKAYKKPKDKKNKASEPGESYGQKKLF